MRKDRAFTLFIHNLYLKLSSFIYKVLSIYRPDPTLFDWIFFNKLLIYEFKFICKDLFNKSHVKITKDAY